jgi:hypothetical protein
MELNETFHSQSLGKGLQVNTVGITVETPPHRTSWSSEESVPLRHKRATVIIAIMKVTFRSYEFSPSCVMMSNDNTIYFVSLTIRQL